MQFNKTWRWILEPSPHTGELKTQTRRLVKPKPSVTVGTYYDFEILTADPVWCEDGTVIEFDKRVITIYTRKPGWISGGYCIEPDEDVTRVKWQVGRTYGVQPSRTAKSVARIRITDIRREHVGAISAEDVKAEGFDSYAAFMMTWISMHDKQAVKAGEFVMSKYVSASALDDALLARVASRPKERYDAWVLTFEALT